MMDLIVSWLCTAISNAFEAATNFFSSVFGYDISVFNQTFSFAAISYDVIRKTALALALILAAWQIITFFTKGAEASTTPIRAALNAVVAVGFIFYGNYLLEMILDFCQYPFDTLLSLNAVDGKIHLNIGITDFIRDAFAGGSMLLYLIMLILVCFSFIKLLLEIVERYVVTFVLLYLSPLASATLATSNTNGIFKKFITMFISQCCLLFLNVWCLKMACSALDLDQFREQGGEALIIPFLLCYAFLRVSAKMDSYINQLGLNAAITGGGLGAELIATGASLMGVGKSGHGAPGETGNKILGAAKTVQTYANRYNPLAAGAKAIKDTAIGAGHGFSEAYRSGGGFRNALSKDGSKTIVAATGKGAIDGLKNSDNLGSNTARVIHHPGQAAPLNTVEQFVHGNGTPAEYMDNLSAVASNEHLAHQAFTYLQDNKSSLNAPIDSKERVAAVVKGLGFEKTSREAADFVKAGFGSGIENISNLEPFQMSGNGIDAQFDTADGYRHKMSIRNQSQFDKLNIEAREGYEKHTLSDGHRYYIKTTKTKREDSRPEKPHTQNDNSTL